MPAVALVPGWGMPASLLAPLGRTLAGSGAMTVPLPGHDGAPMPGAFAVAPVVTALLERLPPSGVWVGWSLGGQLLLEAALRRPPRALVLLATSPRFTAATDWPHGVEPEALGVLRQTCEASPEAARRRFLGLLAGAGDGARAVARTIRAAQQEAGGVESEALTGGLDVLAALDLRERLDQVSCPVLWVMGGADPLMDVAGARWAAARMPGATVAAISGAGHAPFLSHTDACVTAITAFLAQHGCVGTEYHGTM
ncbi:alpha/beta fold hydrolase [Aquisalimonas asiatica]|uniref:Pimeloyl-[acyl-carrier protein] methyl ester esterase n=1 Tax=Aquisalimonas asiatica TaxID=406100 RepID=A0A1H8TK34_9GAMM|nr:alpha/beta fold hydrolase [Aquisalimonas asiatica]SEO91215.1 pimeloyl-[acyl-carrier protein] methyl ester esterase [Aquisalimonas asiatica]